MTDQELERLFELHAAGYRLMNCDEFKDAVREAIAAKTRTLVDALRPMAAANRLVPDMEDAAMYRGCYIQVTYIREAARLVAEYDAAQLKGPTDDCSR